MAAKTKATVVGLMGVNKIGEIARIYQDEGHGDLPVAIIQNGIMADEKMVIANIDTIETAAERNRIKTPAVIVIGDVVGLHESYQTLRNSYALINHRDRKSVV